MSKRKVNRPADDNPVWGQAEFARARPAEAVLPVLFGPEAAEQMLRRTAIAAADEVYLAEDGKTSVSKDFE